MKTYSGDHRSLFRRALGKAKIFSQQAFEHNINERETYSADHRFVFWVFQRPEGKATIFSQYLASWNKDDLPRRPPVLIHRSSGDRWKGYSILSQQVSEHNVMIKEGLT